MVLIVGLGVEERGQRGKSRDRLQPGHGISRRIFGNGLIILLPSMSVPSDWRSSLSAIRDYIQQQI